MIIITQDGRTLDISREYHLHISGYSKSREHKATITVTTFTKEIREFSDGTTYETGDEVITRYGVIGEYATDTGRNQVANALAQAWSGSAEEFLMPQDNFKKSAFEEAEDFCQEHNLIMAGLDELGYTFYEKAVGRDLALTSDYWEKRGVIVSDDYGDYSASLAKWKSLNAQSVAQAS